MVTVRLVDVGARDGVDPRWTPYHSLLDVVAFEPDPVEFARLNAAPWPYRMRVIPVALGSRDQVSATLFVCRAPGCSSLLRPNTDFLQGFEYGRNLEIVQEQSVTLSRMDSVLDCQPDVIKIDTQGTELDILAGAGALLRDTLAVEVEVEFVPIYERQPLFADVDSFMRSQGFVLRGLRRSCWRDKGDSVHPYGGQLVHGDALYIRHELIDSEKGHVILAAYRQFDLLARLGVRRFVPKQSTAVRFFSKFLNGVSNRQLRRLVDSLRSPGAADWHDPDFF